MDATASKLLNQARSEFQRLRLGLSSKTILIKNQSVLLFLWRGDRTLYTISLMLRKQGFNAELEGGLCIIVDASKPDDLFDVFKKWTESPLPDEISLLSEVLNKRLEKWDKLLPEPLLSKNYASSRLDIEGAIQTIKELIDCERVFV